MCFKNRTLNLEGGKHQSKLYNTQAGKQSGGKKNETNRKEQSKIQFVSMENKERK